MFVWIGMVRWFGEGFVVRVVFKVVYLFLVRFLIVFFLEFWFLFIREKV